jgi:hypothetical protein
MPVVILGITQSDIVFRYMNTEYRVARDSVIDIDAREGEGAEGKPATLRLTRDARLVIPQEVAAADVSASLPFSLMRDSATKAEAAFPSAKEALWRNATGYPMPLMINSGFGNDEMLDAFSTGSKSFCGGHRTDDSIVDDG